MKLSDVKKKAPKARSRVRVGRGQSGRRGNSCGRGQRGYGARSGSGGLLRYEGGQTPLFRRLPKRGFSNDRFATERNVVNVGDLNRFSSGDTVNLEALRAKRLVRKPLSGVKVLGRGTIEIPLTVEANAFSKAAARKIRDAGGEVKIV